MKERPVFDRRINKPRTLSDPSRWVRVHSIPQNINTERGVNKEMEDHAHQILAPARDKIARVLEERWLTIKQQNSWWGE